MGTKRIGSFLASFFLRLVWLFLLGSGVLFAQQQFGNIAGEIRLIDGSFPNEQVRVGLEGHGLVVDVSYCDSEGRFGFYNLLGNVYNVVIDEEKYQPFRVSVNVNPAIIQTNFVRVILRPKDEEKPRGAPNASIGANADIVDVAELKKKFPQTAVKEYEAGKKAELKGDVEGATTHYMAAVKEAPDFYPAHNSLGIRHLKNGELKAAEAEFRRVIELNQNGAQAYINLGNVLYMTKRNEEAKDTLASGLRLAPSNAMGRYLNGAVLTRLGDFKTAEEELKAARGLDPKMPQAPISLATLYLQTGKEREAAEMFQEFLKQFPNDPMVPRVRAALSKMAQQQPVAVTP